MPWKPKRPCPTPGCPELTNGGPCAKHAREHRRAWERTETGKPKRKRGRPWRRVRDQVLSEEPLCMVCQDAPTVEVDHIDPNGDDQRDNLQGVCKSCHREKTQAEAATSRWA